MYLKTNAELRNSSYASENRKILKTICDESETVCLKLLYAYDSHIHTIRKISISTDSIVD